ncbi:MULTISPECIES: cysteine desulfurase family protein [Alphaproteobacteria]|uniref:cysteine desulfurase family protein n=1 Tax=Alphaproteobacteria TaxID=28211 RepID=UPI003296BA6B
MKNIYLDYQSSTPTSSTALRAMEPYWAEHYGNPHSREHSAGWAATEAVREASSRIASRLAIGEDEVVFTSGATEANALAILGYAISAYEQGTAARILVGAAEHKSVLEAAKQAERMFGAHRTVLKVDRGGRVDREELIGRLQEGAALLSIGLVNGEIGTIEDIAEIAAIADRFDATLHSDASQATAVTSFKHVLSHAHLVSLSSHKCYGPKGVGALCGRWETLSHLTPLVPGGGQQGGLRGGTVPTPLVVGFSAALEEAQEHLSKNIEHLAAMSKLLFEGLSSAIPNLELVGSDRRHAGNLNVMIPGVDAQTLLAELQPGLSASTGSACASGAEGPSHVLLTIGLQPQEARSCVRLSVGLPTTRAEIDQAVELIINAIDAADS